MIIINAYNMNANIFNSVLREIILALSVNFLQFFFLALLIFCSL